MDTPKPNTDQAPRSDKQNHSESFRPLQQKKRDWLRIIAIVGGIIVLVGFALYSVAMSSLEEARERARNASVHASIQATLPSVLLCLDDPSATVLAPVDNGVLCQGGGSEMKWPSLEHLGGRWEGCTFSARMTEEGPLFNYCAKLPNGARYVCTQDGCSHLPRF